MRRNIHVAIAAVGAFALSLFTHWQPAPGNSARLALGRMASAATQQKPGSELEPLPVVDATLQLIRDKYFEPARVDPRRMFLSALWRIQDEVPSSLLSYDGHSARVVLRVGSQERAFRVDDIQGPWDLSARLREVFAFVELALAPAKTGLRALQYAACDGILQTLDPHSLLLRPARYAEMTPVADSWQNSKAFELIRRPVLLSSVSSRQLAPGIGYVRIEKFQASTANELDHALTELSHEAPLKGLVLDLRDNSGGLLDQAAAVADRFLDAGVIVTVEGASEGREQKLAQRARTQAAYPIAVLMNSISAAGSEIVAGALQQRDRAVVVGERSAGADTIQLVYPHLDPEGAALKLTIARFLLSGEIPVSGVGIAPDIALERVSIDPSAMHFLPLERTRVAARAAKSDKVTPAAPSGLAVRYELPLPEHTVVSAGRNRDDLIPDADFQVRLARDVVARMSVGDRVNALASVRSFVENTRKTEARAISEHLDRLGIDWAPPDKPEQAGPRASDLRASVTTNCAHDTVLAGHSVTITARLTNNAARAIYRVRAVTRSENDYFNGREFLFGRVDPGQTASASVQLGRAPVDAPSRQDIVKLRFSAEGGEPPFDAELRPTITGVAPTSQALELAGVPLASRGERVRIAGSARAAGGVVDVSASVGRRRVAYLSNQGAPNPRKFDFAFDVALDPGLNVITVSVRDKKDVAIRRTVIVRRDGPDGEPLPTPPRSSEVPPPKSRRHSYPERNDSVRAQP